MAQGQSQFGPSVEHRKQKETSLYTGTTKAKTRYYLVYYFPPRSTRLLHNSNEILLCQHHACSQAGVKYMNAWIDPATLKSNTFLQNQQHPALM